MFSKNEIVQELKKISPESQISEDNPHIKAGCRLLGWHLSAPYAQWEYYHAITPEGGVIPFSIDGLVDCLECDI